MHKTKIMTDQNYTCTRELFTDHLIETNKNLYTNLDFADVTLVSDDLVSFEAHRHVLTASSTIFHSLLMKTSTSNNPLLFLKGINNLELRYLLEFVYIGSVQVPESKINTFLIVAQELKIKDIENYRMEDLNGASKTTSKLLEVEQEKVISDEDKDCDIFAADIKEEMNENESYNEDEQLVEAKTKDFVYPVEVEADSNVKNQIEHSESKSRGHRRCKACGKKFKNDWTLRRHTQTVHLGMQYDCNYCVKTFRYADKLRLHINSKHST